MGSKPTHRSHLAPQYHIIFDDNFTTCDVQETDILPDNWDDLYKNKRFEIEFDEHNKWTLDKTWEPLTEFWGHSEDNKHYTSSEKTRENLPDLKLILNTSKKAQSQISNKSELDQYISCKVEDCLKVSQSMPSIHKIDSPSLVIGITKISRSYVWPLETTK